jgi:hypothetical protein
VHCCVRAYGGPLRAAVGGGITAPGPPGIIEGRSLDGPALDGALGYRYLVSKSAVAVVIAGFEIETRYVPGVRSPPGGLDN